MYFLGDVSTIQIFPSTILAPKKLPSELGNVMSMCSSCAEICGKCFCLFTRVPLILSKRRFLHLVHVLHKGDFQSRHEIH